MIDVTKASRETLENLAGNALAWDGCLDEKSCGLHSLRQQELLSKLRAECAPPKLRSRSEVDADIVAVIRKYWDANKGDTRNGVSWDAMDVCAQDLNRLCAEPTAEEPDEPRREADYYEHQPGELDLAEHEVCSCEEAEGLKARVAELEVALINIRDEYKCYKHGPVTLSEFIASMREQLKVLK